MTDIAVATPDNNDIVVRLPLVVLSNKLREARTRAERGGQEWLEASLIIASTMSMARQHFVSNSEFSRWLKDEGHRFNKNDRAALVAMGSDVQTMRDVLSGTPNTSYQVLYRQHKNRFPTPRRMKHRKTQRRSQKRATKEMKLAMRIEILGKATYNRIKDTSLGELAEMEALIELRRNSPVEAEALVQAAEQGKAVSAIAVKASKTNIPAVTADALIERFKHSRFLRFWLSADSGAQDQLITFMQQNRKRVVE